MLDHDNASSAYAWAALLATFMLNAGCGGDGGGADARAVPAPAPAGARASSGGDGSAGSGTSRAAMLAGSAAGGLSFANDVYEQVIHARCSACHTDAPSFGGLAFFPGQSLAYANLVDVPAGPAQGNQCRSSGLMRVQPGDPEHSLLYLKLTNPPCGNKMPPAAFTQVTAEQVSLVRQWIADGAAP
jgi:hypothetical protein